ncbi:hypothetical protein DD237_004719 [Peronospora effusa]|uniref:BUD13 homolog n=1 Tax=Peronospora effusa TaxID=542832 RepID=A0A425BZK4_9STRA|nr:hypothetical protein DD237_004719 [Peronospora effusa]
MTSKLEYLQRYMSGGGNNAADGDKKRKKVKKVKKVKSAAVGTHVIDADDAWEQSAPSREDIDKKWELDVAEDEQPLVVAADGDEVMDVHDLPVYVDSDKYLDEFQGRKKEEKSTKDEDLSPPRKKRGEEGRGNGHEDDEVSPPRRPKNQDASPPRRQPDAVQKIFENRREDSDSNDKTNVLPPKRQERREQRRNEKQSEDASPPRRPARKERDDDASRRDREKIASSQHAQGDVVSPSRRPPVKQKSSVEDNKDTSHPKKSYHMEDGSNRNEQKRRHAPSGSPIVPDRQRRVDSLGRDIRTRHSRSERRSSSASKKDDTTNRHRSKINTRSRSNSRENDRDRERSAYVPTSSRRERQSRCRSPRTRRSDSRLPSGPRRRSPRKSTRWGSPRRDDSTRGRSHSRSRAKHVVDSSSRRSRSRSHSPKRRSSRRESVDLAESRDDYNAYKSSRTVMKSPSRTAVKSPLRNDLKSENAGGSKLKKDPNIGTHDVKEEKKAGLFTAAEFDRQRKIAAKENDIMRGIDAFEMGANAKTVYRDKRGRKLDMLNEMVWQQEVRDGKRKREEREEYEWGTGEVQKQERKSQLELMEQMKNTPFARYEDDEELEQKRRGRVRAFDPLNSKIFQEDPLAEGKSKTKKKSKKDKKASNVKRKYAGPPAPPNRFNIMPGYRWDGVVRGTNWEEKIMMRQNASTAVSEEAYKYAVADM